MITLLHCVFHTRRSGPWNVTSTRIWLVPLTSGHAMVVLCLQMQVLEYFVGRIKKSQTYPSYTVKVMFHLP
ncbi:hypothetical protein GDO81_004728 [Engystomops pustulosus]|uniref:Uncharacterized protein n=1 Tax=Engystomops pustulosus TaxID=76066 RepID=A0AAV7CI07_ENGPU|nr:hypothetical protein GDO81_004728 [Engystomops pustulosus]